MFVRENADSLKERASSEDHFLPFDLWLTDAKSISNTAVLRKEHTGISMTFILLCIYVIIKHAFVACIIKGQNIW